MHAVGNVEDAYRCRRRCPRCSFCYLIADLGEGILDPFPLLQGSPAEPRGPFRKVNPVLLVTERKGEASSLHYGAFPLDAFHTDGTPDHMR